MTAVFTTNLVGAGATPRSSFRLNRVSPTVAVVLATGSRYSTTPGLEPRIRNVVIGEMHVQSEVACRSSHHSDTRYGRRCDAPAVSAKPNPAASTGVVGLNDTDMTPERDVISHRPILPLVVKPE